MLIKGFMQGDLSLRSGLSHLIWLTNLIVWCQSLQFKGTEMKPNDAQISQKQKKWNQIFLCNNVLKIPNHDQITANNLRDQAWSIFCNKSVKIFTHSAAHTIRRFFCNWGNRGVNLKDVEVESHSADVGIGVWVRWDKRRLWGDIYKRQSRIFPLF